MWTSDTLVVSRELGTIRYYATAQYSGFRGKDWYDLLALYSMWVVPTNKKDFNVNNDGTKLIILL
jgi:hypothetical protein